MSRRSRRFQLGIVCGLAGLLYLGWTLRYLKSRPAQPHACSSCPPCSSLASVCPSQPAPPPPLPPLPPPPPPPPLPAGPVPRFTAAPTRPTECPPGTVSLYERISPLGQRPLHHDPIQLLSQDPAFMLQVLPKVGSTSLMTWVAGVIGFELPDADKVYFHLPGAEGVRSPKYAPHVDAISKVRHMWRFTMVRNPFARLLSAYQSKMTNLDRNVFFIDLILPCMSRERAEEIEAYGGDGLVMTFDEFVEAITGGDGNGNVCGNPHWVGQVDQLNAPPSAFDAVAHMENFAADMNFLSSLLGVDSDIANMNPSKVSAGNKANLLAAYSNPDTVARVVAFAQRDFSVLGYSTDIAQAHLPQHDPLSQVQARVCLS